MATRCLNKTVKKEIRDSIEHHVRKKMEESIPGKELEQIKAELVAFLVHNRSALFTKTELKTLKKFGAVDTMQYIRIGVNKNKGTLERPWNYGTKGKNFTLTFDPVFQTPRTSDFWSDGFIDALEKDERADHPGYHP